jgi:predicted transposase YdaD
MDNKAAEEYMLKQAKSEGKAEGKAEEKVKIAKAMLLDGDSAEKIAKITCLSVAEITKLKS